MIEAYRKKGILALVAVFPENRAVIYFEHQIYVRSKTEREYFFDIYQLCGDVLSGKVPATLKFGFEHPNWDSVRVITKPDDEEVIEDSVLQCNKCKSNKIVSDTRQTRGGDEGATVFATCTDCGNAWATHG